MALSVETGLQTGLNLLNRHMNDFQEHNTRLCSLIESEITRMTKFHQIRQMATKLGTGTSLVGLLVECASYLPAFKDSAQTIKSVGSFLESAGDLTKSGASFLDTIITRELLNELNALAQSYNKHAQVITRELTGLRTFAHQRYRFEQLNDRNQQNIVNDLLPVIPLVMNGMSARDSYRQLRDECVGNGCVVTEESSSHMEIQLVETEQGHHIKIDESSKTTKTTQPPSGKELITGFIYLLNKTNDVINLFKTWDENHPTVFTMQVFLDQLREDSDRISHMRQFIFDAFGNPNHRLRTEILDQIDNEEDLDWNGRPFHQAIEYN